MNYQAEKLAEWQKEAEELLKRQPTSITLINQAQVILALVELARRQEKMINLLVSAMANSWVGESDD